MSNAHVTVVTAWKPSKPELSTFCTNLVVNSPATTHQVLSPSFVTLLAHLRVLVGQRKMSSRTLDPLLLSPLRLTTATTSARANKHMVAQTWDIYLGHINMMFSGFDDTDDDGRIFGESS